MFHYLSPQASNVQSSSLLCQMNVLQFMLSYASHAMAKTYKHWIAYWLPSSSRCCFTPPLLKNKVFKRRPNPLGRIRPVYASSHT
mmetsp:Transcript_1664/g.2660  ORF Transcript_1664/g.2660 Transcript_1664/m.2660 type:complete len:85 (+) Transcript_1664:216-470(+)